MFMSNHYFSGTPSKPAGAHQHLRNLGVFSAQSKFQNRFCERGGLTSYFREASYRVQASRFRRHITFRNDAFEIRIFNG